MMYYSKRGILMKSVPILLPDVAAIKHFVAIVETFDFDVDLIAGRYRINAKSLMGIFSLGAGIPMTMEIHCDDDAAIKRLMDRIAPYLAD